MSESHKIKIVNNSDQAAEHFNELLILKKQYADLYDHSPHCYITINENLVIQSVNLSTARLLNLEPENIINHSLIEFIPSNFHALFIRYIALIISNKSREKIEVELIKKSGQSFYVRLESVQDDNFNILISIIDISKEMQLELNILESKKTLSLLEDLFQSTSEAIGVLDRQYNFTILNKAFLDAFLHVFKKPVLANMNLHQFLKDYPDLQSKFIQGWEKAISGEKVMVPVENDSDDEGVYYCYEVYLTPLYSSINQNNLGMILIVRNVSKYHLSRRRQTKEHAALAAASRMNAAGEMAAALAHEINQPLAAINIYSHSCLKLFKSETNPNPKILNGLEQIMSLSLHAGKILHRMKNFIRQGEVLKERTDLNELIMQALNFLHHQQTETKYEIQLTLAPNLPMLIIDRVKIIQVILNLVQNSIEAITNKSKKLIIEIKTEFNNQYIEISVCDNGPGIPEKLADKIMKSYFTTKKHGTGLGLPICRTLIEAHGGRLFIKKAAHKGACILFTLPISNIEEATGATKN